MIHDNKFDNYKNLIQRRSGFSRRFLLFANEALSRFTISSHMYICIYMRYHYVNGILDFRIGMAQLIS